MKPALVASLVLFSASLHAQPDPTQGSPIENVCGSAAQSEAQRQNCIRQEELSRTNIESNDDDPAVQDFCRSMVGHDPAIVNACITQENISKSNIASMSVVDAAKQRCEADAGGSYVKMEAC